MEVQRSLAFDPQPGCAVALRLTPQIKQALLAAHAAGQQLSLRLVGNETPEQAVLQVGGAEHAFSVTSQAQHDLIHMPASGEARVLASVRHKLQAKPPSDTGAVGGRLRAAGEEAARKRQENATVKLTDQSGRPSKRQEGPTARIFSVHRAATPPPNAGTPPMPPPRSSTPVPPGAQPPARATPTPPPGPSAAPQPAPQKKPLQPLKPGAVAKVVASNGKRAGTPPPGSISPSPSPKVDGTNGTAPGSTAPAGGSSAAPAPAPPAAAAAAAAPTVPAEPPQEAVVAAKYGELQLVLVALLSDCPKGMPSSAVLRLIDQSYRLARRAAEAKEYVKRVLDAATERAPPGNRLILKEDVWEKEAPRLKDLVEKHRNSPPPTATQQAVGSKPSQPSPAAPAVASPSAPKTETAAGSKPAPAKPKKRPLGAATGTASPSASPSPAAAGPSAQAERPTKKAKPSVKATAVAAGNAASPKGNAPSPKEDVVRMEEDEPPVRLPHKSRAHKEARQVRGISAWDEEESDDDMHLTRLRPAPAAPTAQAPAAPPVVVTATAATAGGVLAPPPPKALAQGVSGAGPAALQSAARAGPAQGTGPLSRAAATGPMPAGPTPAAGPAPASATPMLAPPPPPLPSRPTEDASASNARVEPPGTQPQSNASSEKRAADKAAAAGAANKKPAPAARPPAPAQEASTQAAPPKAASPRRPTVQLPAQPASQQQPADSTPSPSSVAAPPPPDPEEELWAAVQVVEDQPSEVEEYEQFLASPPPSPHRPPHLGPEALASLEDQYTRYHALHFKIKQKYNQAMLELEALLKTVEQAAQGGDTARAARLHRDLWVRGAGYTPALAKWQRALAGLNSWLTAARRIAADVLLAQAQGTPDTMPGAGSTGSGASLALTADL